jgi:AcrR family transcriptional regulator
MGHKKNNIKKEILSEAVRLFAKIGYNGTSMRSIARAVGVSAAALYNHFPSKENLYQQALKQAFTDKGNNLLKDLSNGNSAQQRLTSLIGGLCSMMAKDADFTTLVSREMAENNDKRLRVMSEQVFSDIYGQICKLSEELFPELDPHLAACSIVGLVFFPMESRKLRRHLPGWNEENDDPSRITAHASSLLFNRIYDCGSVKPSLS